MIDQETIKLKADIRYRDLRIDTLKQVVEQQYDEIIELRAATKVLSEHQVAILRDDVEAVIGFLEGADLECGREYVARLKGALEESFTGGRNGR